MEDRSFLDIITNVFAVFILIILFFLLIFRQEQIMMVEGMIIPIEKQVKKDFFYLEVVDHYIIPITADHGYTKYYKIIKKDYGEICVQKKNLLIKKGEKFNFYNKKSIYYHILKKLNPSDYYLVFLVRPSGFNYYHEFVKVAKMHNFEVGWYPYMEQEPLKFSKFGRTIGVQ